MVLVIGFIFISAKFVFYPNNI